MRGQGVKPVCVCVCVWYFVKRYFFCFSLIVFGLHFDRCENYAAIISWCDEKHRTRYNEESGGFLCRGTFVLFGTFLQFRPLKSTLLHSRHSRFVTFWDSEWEVRAPMKGRTANLAWFAPIILTFTSETCHRIATRATWQMLVGHTRKFARKRPAMAFNCLPEPRIATRTLVATCSRISGIRKVCAFSNTKAHRTVAVVRAKRDEDSSNWVKFVGLRIIVSLRFVQEK